MFEVLSWVQRPICSAKDLGIETKFKTITCSGYHEVFIINLMGSFHECL